jgi:hypothetical protein
MSMRALTLASGVAVLFATLGFLHVLVHRFIGEVPGFHRVVIAALMGVGALSFIGGCLLLKRAS